MKTSDLLAKTTEYLKFNLNIYTERFDEYKLKNKNFEFVCESYLEKMTIVKFLLNLVSTHSINIKDFIVDDQTKPKYGIYKRTEEYFMRDENIKQIKKGEYDENNGK